MSITEYMDEVKSFKAKFPMWNHLAASLHVADLHNLPVVEDDGGYYIYYGGRAPRWYDWFIWFFTMSLSNRTDCHHFHVSDWHKGFGIPLYHRYM